ncbi:unnamed protein product [Pleuronectes platessa]|uniref:Uncharacterized protein n=1 Tax=Pleuronectes platessa TaxID=8262 RepID=A0A9N7TJ10_PLEPL|nr:unnamed protein product [Pleuronectes platessa]
MRAAGGSAGDHHHVSSVVNGQQVRDLEPTGGQKLSDWTLGEKEPASLTPSPDGSNMRRQLQERFNPEIYPRDRESNATRPNPESPEEDDQPRTGAIRVKEEEAAE